MMGKWSAPRFSSNASIEKWRQKLAELVCVKADCIEDTFVFQFMSEMKAYRSLVTGEPYDHR